jgi:putative ABC transport system permease protein
MSTGPNEGTGVGPGAGDDARRWMSGAEVRAVTRLARRTARREWKRTTLVGALVMIPVMVAVVVAGLMRAAQITEEDRVTAEMGSADLRVELWSEGYTVDTDSLVVAEKLLADIPVEHRLTIRSSWMTVRAVSDTADSSAFWQPRVTDQPIDHALTDGMLVLIEGRTPVGPGEVALTLWLAHRLEVGLGDRVEVGSGNVAEVVGTIINPISSQQDVVAVTAAMMDAALGDRDPSRTWLLGGVADTGVVVQRLWQDYDEATGYSQAHDRYWADVDAGEPVAGDVQGRDALPAHLGVTSREDQLSANWQGGLERAMTPEVVGTLVAALLLAEVALIAAAAYATGARRRLRELGLLGANGATAAHVRAAVVGEAAVTGLLGAVVGLVAGVLVLVFGQHLFQPMVQRWMTGVELAPTDLIGPLLAGVIAVAVAAWLPARTAASVPTSTALQGRMPLSEPKRWIAPAGVVLAGFGALLLLVGLMAGGSAGAVVAAIGILFSVAGMALLTVPMMAAVGRRADRTGATLRLVLRDSARQRTRAAAASASAMIVLMAPVMIATMILTATDKSLVDGLPEPATHVFVMPDEYLAEGERWYGPGQSRELDQAPPTRDVVVAEVEALVGAAPVDVIILDQRATLGPSPRFASQNAFLDPGPTHAVGSDGFWDAWGGSSVLVAVGTPDVLEALGDATAAAHLEQGRLVVLGLDARDTTVTIGDRELAAVERPVPVMRHQFPRVLVGEETAAELGLQPAGTADLFVAAAPIDTDTRMALFRAAEPYPIQIGSQNRDLLFRWVVLAISLLIAMLILVLVTMLSATESDHDLRTMVAVGAAPRMRRRFLGLQGGLYALVGAILAIPLAVGLAWASERADGGYFQGTFGIAAPGQVNLDWPVMGTVLIGVPLAIGVVIALLVRSAPTVPPRRVG